MTTLPLFNILSYESSVVNAVLFSILSGFYWLKFGLQKCSKTHLTFCLAAIITPFLILSISTILCQKCPLDDGIYFYIVIALPSIPVGIAISLFATLISERLKYLLFIAIWIIILLGFLPELYFNPQIYFYNPIFGFYPGVIYDQGIAISSSLIFYRILNLLFSIMLIYFLNKHSGSNKKKTIIAIILIYLSIFVLPIKSFLGFESDLQKTKNKLKNEISTEHFNIIFPDTLSENESKILVYEHEYYYKAISELLGSEVDGKITSIIYGSREQKKDLFGSANADVAKPWLNQIYITLDNYDNSLKHEIAHIFSANYADGLFKIPSNFNPGMIEGFAMAVENNYDEFDIDYLASLAYKSDYKISLTSLFSGLSFFSNASSISYIYAGSFLKYLANIYGWDKVKEVYVGKDFNSVFGEDLSSLENKYNKYIDKFSIDSNNEASKYYFGRTPLIKRYCARATANNLSEAVRNLEDSNYVESGNKFIEIYNYSKTYSALVGYVHSQKENKNIEESIKLLKTELSKYENSSSYFYLQFLLADYYALSNDSINASKYYQKIIKQNPHLRYLRSAKVKNELLAKGDSLLIKFMNDKKLKTETICDLVKNEPNDYNIQYLTRLKIENDSDYVRRIEIIKEVINEKSYSPDTHFLISKYAYKNLDLDISMKHANEALIRSDYKRKQIIIDHINKIEWIKSNNKY